MRAIFVIFIASFLLPFDLQAQEIGLHKQNIECGTYFDPKDTVHIPHFGQNVILDLILDITMKRQSSDLKSSTISIDANNRPFHIPVKIWVYRNNDGDHQALSEANVHRLFNEVNRLYAVSNTGIQFYMKCSIEYVNSTQFNTIDSDNEFNTMIATYYEPFSLNWHLVRNTTSGWDGKATFPWDINNPNFCLAVNCSLESWEFAIVANTTVHEIGHTLGLLHTHQNVRQGGYNGDASDCYQESVSRTRTQGIICISTIGIRKCEINGDALCDTEAAPNSASNKHINVDNNCNYTGRGTDNWGDAWIPPIRNYMSYVALPSSFIPCENNFTSGQIAGMHNAITYYMRYGNTPWFNLHSISLSGTVYSGENESIIISHNIEAAGSNTYTINSGASVDLFAGESITLKQDFHAKTGSVFRARVGDLTGCSNVYPVPYRGDSNTMPVSSLSQDDIDECLSIIEKALNREYMNYGKGNDEAANKESAENKTFSFTVYPNPASGFLTVDYTLHADATICIELYNTYGQRIKVIAPQQNQKAGDYSIKTSVSDLVAGTYFIKVTSGSHIESKQLIINK